MNSLGLVIVVIGLILGEYTPSMAIVYDTGWVTRKQPDGTVFVGRDFCGPVVSNCQTKRTRRIRWNASSL